MALIIQKFGGTSVADAARLCALAERIGAQRARGDQVVTVLSAQGKTTDALLEKARELWPDCGGRELDQLLACGEQMSASLCAMALASRGVPAVSLTGAQAGIFTDGTYASAWPRLLICDRIERELAAGKAVIVTGFQGINREGDVTTLGRGGSDTTAVALCHFLGAGCCRIYTDVDGVYTADPRTDPGAQKLERISYDRMLCMAQNGARVLHDRCVMLAKQWNITLEVCSSFDDRPGTLVTAEERT
jgi:aspartate kinase